MMLLFLGDSEQWWIEEWLKIWWGMGEETTEAPRRFWMFIVECMANVWWTNLDLVKTYPLTNNLDKFNIDDKLLIDLYNRSSKVMW